MTKKSRGDAKEEPFEEEDWQLSEKNLTVCATHIYFFTPLYSPDLMYSTKEELGRKI